MNWPSTRAAAYRHTMKTTFHPACRRIAAKTPRIIALLVLALLALLAVTGCRSGDSAVLVDPAGVYTLVSVNGESVPCETRHGKTPMTINSGMFTIRADGTCHSLMKFSVSGHPEVTREVKATYSQRGDEITMKWERAGVTRGTVASNEFTMTNEGMVLSYRKER